MTNKYLLKAFKCVALPLLLLVFVPIAIASLIRICIKYKKYYTHIIDGKYVVNNRPMMP